MSETFGKSDRLEAESALEQASLGSRFWAGMGYLSFLCFFPLFLKRNDDFALFHARQGLVLFVAWLILIAASIFPILGGVVWDIGHLIVFLLSLVGIFNAASGARRGLPVIGKVAQGFEEL